MLVFSCDSSWQGSFRYRGGNVPSSNEKKEERGDNGEAEETERRSQAVCVHACVCKSMHTRAAEVGGAVNSSLRRIRSDAGQVTRAHRAALEVG